MTLFSELSTVVYMVEDKNMNANFSNDSLKINPEKEVEKITTRIRTLLSQKLKRRGLVLGLSGGIDSSVTAGLCARAIGAERVFALLMPERHSSDETLEISKSVADTFHIACEYANISSILDSVGFYTRYNNAVKSAIPEYGEGWKSKIVITNSTEKKSFNLFYIVAKSPVGKVIKRRLPLKAYLEIVAATNFKQRIRKMIEYYHADRLNYAVAGTPNRLEYDQGFFVKLGDGAADLKPIAHLYKTQVYQLAEYLGVPEKVLNRPPTTDTYSLEQGQDEFYFSLPYQKMDLCLYAKNNKVPLEAVADLVGLKIEQIKMVYEDIDRKRRTTKYLHSPALLIEKIEEITV